MDYTVVDLETTGIYPRGHDRIVEVAVVSLRPDLTVAREFATLLNPERDIGPTWLHGIRTADVLEAPTFSELAGTLVDLLRDTVIVGHNVVFDLRFLESEFARAGSVIPRLPYLDTMVVALRMGAPSRKLQAACDYFGIETSRSHSALCDARATASLFTRCVDHFGRGRLSEWVKGPYGSMPIDWPRLEARCALWPRERAAEASRGASSFLGSLVQNLPASDDDPHDWQPYYAVLDRALEDRRISQDEAVALSESAIQAGLSANDVKAANEAYLTSLIAVALHDNVLSDLESEDIDEVAKLLHLEGKVEQLLAGIADAGAARSLPNAQSELQGRTVCFTGAMNARIDGERATREQARVIAVEQGMIVVERVTKKLDYLVVADPDSLSGKAKKARKYGTRILAESVFWNLTGVSTDA